MGDPGISILTPLHPPFSRLSWKGGMLYCDKKVKCGTKAPGQDTTSEPRHLSHS